MSNSGRSWIEEIRARGPVDVGEAFGLAHGERGPGYLEPCPACGADKRHPSRKDKRGALGLTRDGGGWSCFQCEETGDAVTLAAWCSLGRAPGKGDAAGWADVRRACADKGLCESDERDTRSVVKVARRPTPAPRKVTLPDRLPPAEVVALWGACSPVLADAEVTAWLRDARGLDAGEVEARDLARALPVGLALPRWARFKGKAWNEAPQGFRVILPMFDADGRLASLHARALRPQVDNGSDKTAAPAGAALAGLVLADSLGQLLLSGKPRGNGLVVAEGDPDFLALGTWWGDADELAPAVLGVVSGSWNESTAELAAKVPDGCRVRLFTDPDAAGDGYAAKIYRSLRDRVKSGRVTVERWQPRGGA